jgi:hypothetical protein
VSNPWLLFDGGHMTIRIDGAALVLRRDILDRRWPGGSEAFIEEWEDDDPSVTHDEDLVALDLFDIRGHRELLEWFADLGIVGRVGIVWWHLAIVDEEWGPTGRCDWLEFVRTEEKSLVWRTPILE